MRLLPYLVIFRSSLGHSFRHGWSHHVTPRHLRHCPLPPGQPVTGSLWVPQSAAEPPLGGGAVADMKEEKAAMDCRLAEGLDRQVLGLTRGVGPRPALPLPRLFSCLKDSDAC